MGALAKRQGSSLGLAVRALRAWGPRQVASAAAASLVVGLMIGMGTVLIPNSIFGREIPPTAWNYPVWIATSILSGILVATYVRPRGDSSNEGATSVLADGGKRRAAGIGWVGGMLSWFAVGCPVCNKIALVVLGYTGALTWFAPVQPLLAALALVLSVVAVISRLRGQIACPTRPLAETTAQ